MKKLLATGVIFLGLVSCSNTDEMKVQCVIAFRGGYPDKVLEKAQKYIFDNTGITEKSDIDFFCRDYLE